MHSSLQTLTEDGLYYTSSVNEITKMYLCVADGCSCWCVHASTVNRAKLFSKTDMLYPCGVPDDLHHLTGL